MKRIREEHRKIIFSSGGIGVPCGRRVSESLSGLRLCLRLKSLGLTFFGNEVGFCRAVLSPKQRKELERIEKRRNGMLVIREHPAGEKRSGCFRKNREVQTGELVAAACGDELFSLIDLHPETFEKLSDQEGMEETDRVWKERKVQSMGYPPENVRNHSAVK